jgi:hypothetical protein
MRKTTIAALLLAAGCAEGRATEAGAPVQVAAAGAGAPTVATTADAHLVAWVQKEGEVQNLYLARTDGQTAGAPVRVNRTPGDASTHDQAPPQVALGPSGDVYVVWQTSREVSGRHFPASDLRFARSADGGRTFGPTLTVNDDAGGLPSGHTFHNVAVGRDGAVYVSWLDSRVRDRTRAEWIASGKLKPAGGHGGHGANPAEAELPGSEIRVAKWTPATGRFTPGVVVDGGVCPCCRTSLAVGPDGAVYVAWRKVFDGDVRDVVLARSTDGGATFSAPAAVRRDGWVFPGCPHAGPSVAVDGRGRVYVGWYTGKAERQGLWLARSDDGGARFGEARAVLTDAAVPPSQLRLAPDSAGVWAAWEDRRTPERTVRVARIDDAGVHEADAVPGAVPSIASTGGRAGVVWQEQGGVRVRTLR